MVAVDKEKRTHRKFEQTLAPVIMNFGVANYLAGLDAQRVKWDHQTYVPKEKYTVDYVWLTEDGTLLHLEQETSGISGMQPRMLEYATALAITSQFKRKIARIAYTPIIRLEQCFRGIGRRRPSTLKLPDLWPSPEAYKSSS